MQQTRPQMAENVGRYHEIIPDSKFHVVSMGLTWGRHDPGGPHGGPMNPVVRDIPLYPYQASLGLKCAIFISFKQRITFRKCNPKHVSLFWTEMIQFFLRFPFTVHILGENKFRCILCSNHPIAINCCTYHVDKAILTCANYVSTIPPYYLDGSKSKYTLNSREKSLDINATNLLQYI